MWPAVQFRDRISRIKIVVSGLAICGDGGQKALFFSWHTRRSPAGCIWCEKSIELIGCAVPEAWRKCIN
jgi:hypothetical protein